MNPEVCVRLMMLVVWFAFMHLMTKGLGKSIASRHWVQVKGKVISAKVGSRSGPRRSVAVPVVTYSYTYHGRSYQSDGYTFLGTSGGFAGGGFGWQMQNRLAPYVPGRLVDVFVNPDAPAEAVLVPGVHWAQYATYVGITLFCAGVAFIVDILNFIWPGCQPNCR